MGMMSAHISEPYRVIPYVGPHLEPVNWCVVGPGLGGWQGVVPRSHAGMEKGHALELAELLNRAYRLGETHRSRQLMHLLDDQ